RRARSLRGRRRRRARLPADAARLRRGVRRARARRSALPESSAGDRRRRSQRVPRRRGGERRRAEACARSSQMRIGTTSCIWHDYMLPNVEKLAPLVDDVELLLFDIERDVPSAEDVSQLVRLKHEHALSYTLHTPLDASLASADEARRATGIDKVRRAIDWARPLAPLAHRARLPRRR